MDNPSPEKRVFEPEPCANCDLGNWRTCRCKWAVWRRQEEAASAPESAPAKRRVVSPTSDGDRPVSPERVREDIARLRKMLGGENKAS